MDGDWRDEQHALFEYTVCCMLEQGIATVKGSLCDALAVEVYLAASHV